MAAESDEDTQDHDHDQSSKKETTPPSSAANMPKKEEHQKQMTYSYSREEMLTIRENKLSRTRPAMLSKEFDNEDGLFSPDKWLQHRWQCEGVENRVKRKPTSASGANAIQIGANATTKALLASIMETASNNSSEMEQKNPISPQLRHAAFFATQTIPNVKEEKHQTVATSSVKSRWRQGQLNNGVDFKPAFQKTALEANSRSSRSGSSQNTTASLVSNGTGSWIPAPAAKHWGDKNNHRGGNRERTRSSNTENEHLPEWMDEGPNSIMDVIELKGFDDDPSNEKKRRRSRGKEKEPSPSVGTKTGKAANVGRDTSATHAEKAPSRPRSSARQKRHSGGDIHNISRPNSRQTPQAIGNDSRKNSLNSQIHPLRSPVPVQIIQASDLESSILKEQQAKFNNAANKEGGNGKKMDVFALLGLQQPSTEQQKQQQSDRNKLLSNKLPNSDAEFAAFILGLSADQLAKPVASADVPNPNVAATASIPTMQHQETSRLSRFFAKNNAAGEGASIQHKEGKESTQSSGSQFDLSALQAQLGQQQNDNNNTDAAVSSTSRQTSTPPIVFQRAASVELQQLNPQLSSLLQANKMRHSPPRTFIPNSIGVPSKFSGLPSVGDNVSPDFNAQREALLQQMQDHMPSFNPAFSAQQQQIFMDQMLRKRTPPGVPSPFGRPSSTEHPHQMLQSPFYPLQHNQQQRHSPMQQMGPPPLPPPMSGGGGTFGAGPLSMSAQFQHLLMQTARQMQPNPNAQPDLATLRNAYIKLNEDPNIRAMALNGVFGPPLPHHFSSAGGPFPPPGPPNFFGGPAASHHNFPPLPPPQHFGHHPPPMPPQQQFGVPPMHHHQFPAHRFGTGPAGGMGPPMPANSYHAQQQQPNPYHVTFPPPNIGQQPQQQLQQQKFGQNPNLLNSTAFMPTSVMRQMSKGPGGGSSASDTSMGGGGSVSNMPQMFLQKLFADVSHQQPTRAILGRDPMEMPQPKNPPRISGCLKLEEIEQRELAAYQQSTQHHNNPSSMAMGTPSSTATIHHPPTPANQAAL